MNFRNVWPKLLAATASLLPASVGAHVHIQIGYHAGAWDLHVLDFESGRFLPAEYPFAVALAARSPAPAGPGYVLLLGAAENVWILPENEAPDLLNLGLGTSGIGDGQFTANRVRLELHRLDGPGEVALFTTSAFGAPQGHWISRDGVNSAADFITLPAINGHVHVNWVFTRAGVYRLGIAASATIPATGQTFRSPVVDYTFFVAGPARPHLGITPPRNDGIVELQVTAPAGSRVEIQAATAAGEWLTLGELIGTGQPQSFLTPATPSSMRLFRAVSF